MNIAFTSKKGSCPSFTYDNIKYYIQDSLYDKNYKYQLFSKKLAKETFIFNSHEKLKEFLDLNNAHFMAKYSESTCYKNKSFYFRVEELKIIKMHQEVCETLPYEKYINCLNDSKKIIKTRIKIKEPTQISLF